MIQYSLEKGRKLCWNRKIHFAFSELQPHCIASSLQRIKYYASANILSVEYFQDHIQDCIQYCIQYCIQECIKDCLGSFVASGGWSPCVVMLPLDMESSLLVLLTLKNLKIFNARYLLASLWC